MGICNTVLMCSPYSHFFSACHASPPKRCILGCWAVLHAHPRACCDMTHPHAGMLCHAPRCARVLCCAVLCCAAAYLTHVLCCAALCCAVLCCATASPTCCAALCCAVLLPHPGACGFQRAPETAAQQPDVPVRRQAGRAQLMATGFSTGCNAGCSEPYGTTKGGRPPACLPASTG